MSELLHALSAALDGTTPPIEFTPATAGGAAGWILREDLPASAAALEEQHGERVAVVVRTSGSTGTPKQTLLSAPSLRASAEATAAHLGGHGQWMLTLQPSYVAGLAVLSRSLIAGTTPVALLEHTTDPQSFAQAAEQMTAPRRFVSLVPTQLSRLLDSGHPRTLAALRRFDAVLLGGGASSPELLARAEASGIHVVRTYGMAETCGGCVYDGRPLPGVSLRAGAPDSPGPISIAGPMVALGYTDPDLTGARFDRDESGHRRFLTDDLGHLVPAHTETADDDAVLRVTGRADDVIITGGVKVSAEAVRAALEADPRIAEAFVGAAEDPDWGQRVCAAIVPRTGAEPSGDGPTRTGLPTASLPEDLAATLRSRLGPAAVPRQVHMLEELPRLSTGKPDRRRLRALFSRSAPAELPSTFSRN